MKTILSSLLLATTLVLPSLVVAVKPPPVCKEGVFKVFPYLTAKEVRHLSKNEKLALKHAHPICQCEDDDEDTEYFVSTSGKDDAGWLNAVNKLGRTKLGNAIESWLDDDSTRAKMCATPADGGAAMCEEGECNVKCPVGFQVKIKPNGEKKCIECAANKEVVEGKCQACPATRICNGVCQPTPCGPQPSKRLVARSQQLREGEAECLSREGGGWKLCRTASAHGQMGTSAGWSCMNVLSGLESCGGCPFDRLASIPVSHGPHPALQPLDANAISNSLFLTDVTAANEIGQDCSSIAHANSVGCLQGRCVVESCLRGWNISENGATCVKA